jgi:threonine aldolase
LENSLSNGRVWPLESLKAVKELADKYSLKIHIDGARVFNASVSVGCEVK